jgi:type IV pilus assembly protein PilP
MFMFEKAMHQFTVPTQHLRATAWYALALSLLLAACANDKFEDLNQYIKEVQARAGTPIAPLPDIKPYERFVYRDENLRDPFRPATKAPAPAAAAAGSKSKLRPNIDRNREALEQYTLDTLKMVGSLNKDKDKWAIIKTSDGLIYRVKAGNHIGKNFGEITRITDKQVDITEIISDGLGSWIERQATLKISQ